MTEKLGLLFVVGLFALAVLSRRFQLFLGSRFFLFFGFVSYPLYLEHDTILRVSLQTFAALMPSIPEFCWPIPPIAISVLVARIIATWRAMVAQLAI